MALPTLLKTWQLAHTTIPTQGSSLANMQHTLRVGIVNVLLAMTTNPPTVKGSSDSTTAAMDNTNRWSADNKLVWANAGSAHSWIVLQFLNGWQMMIDLSNTTTTIMTVFYSPSAGFTGGSTTAAPTATDQFASPFGTTWMNTSTDTQRVCHVWMPTDATGFRVLVYKTNILESYWQIETPVNTTTGWVTPMVAFVGAFTLLQKPLYGDLSQGTGFTYQGKGPNSPFFVAFELTTEGAGTSGAIGQVQTTANGIDGSWPMTTIGIYTTTTANVGLQGRLADCWFGSTTRNTGDFYPSGVTNQFVQIGNLIWPWDGTTTLVTA